MSSPVESSGTSQTETSPELGGSIWKGFRAHQLASLAWWDRFTQKNATATARDAWRDGQGQPDCSKGLFNGPMEDEVIAVDSPITINHVPPQSQPQGQGDVLKWLLMAGSIALAGTGVGTGLGVGAWLLSNRPASATDTDTSTDIGLGGGVPVDISTIQIPGDED